MLNSNGVFRCDRSPRLPFVPAGSPPSRRLLRIRSPPLLPRRRRTSNCMGMRYDLLRSYAVSLFWSANDLCFTTQVLGTCTVEQAYGGMRSVKSMVTETSLLDAQEVSAWVSPYIFSYALVSHAWWSLPWPVGHPFPRPVHPRVSRTAPKGQGWR